MRFRNLDLPIDVEAGENPVDVINHTDPGNRWVWYVNAPSDDIEFDLLRFAEYPWCQRLEVVLKLYRRESILDMYDRVNELAKKYWCYDSRIDKFWVRERIRLALLYKDVVEEKGSLKQYRQ